MDTLAQLALDFLSISLIAVGGAAAVLPEIQRNVVEVHGWMTPAQFSELFGLANAAPGPNVIIVALIGWHVAGVAGAGVATAAICAPSCLLTFVVLRLWQKFRDAPWTRAIENGLAPITVGLVLASAYLVTRGSNESWVAYALTALSVAVMLGTRFNPLWLIGVGALAGLAGVV
jgi:chromate transporter